MNKNRRQHRLISRACLVCADKRLARRRIHGRPSFWQMPSVRRALAAPVVEPWPNALLRPALECVRLAVCTSTSCAVIIDFPQKSRSLVLVASIKMDRSPRRAGCVWVDFDCSGDRPGYSYPVIHYLEYHRPHKPLSSSRVERTKCFGCPRPRLN